MPRLLALRRLLWRLNGVLGVGLAAIIGGWLLFPHAEAPLPNLDYEWPTPGPRESKPSVDPIEMAEQCRQFWPMEAQPERPAPRSEDEPTRPPLAAYEVAMWFRMPGETDLIALRCKDPAHADWLYPAQNCPDRAFSIASVKVLERHGLITVAREGERHTFRVPLHTSPDPRIVRVADRRRLPMSSRAEVVASASRTLASHPRLRDLKCVPYYGSSGEVAGMRVTGIRPGSRFEAIGLVRGDVIVRAGDATPTSGADLAQTFEDGRQSVACTVQRASGPRGETVELHLP